MVEERARRRLAAILAVDMVGYSRLVHDDEAGTLSAFKVLRRDLLEPLIAQHGGRIFKFTGDGALAEFGSAVDAVGCAVQIQKACGDNERSQDKHIVLRIGIHVGDVVVDDGDLFGDGVNIAARLEGLADPGGVLISDDTRRQVGNRLDFAFEDLGLQSLKNIPEPIRTFRVGAVASTAKSFGKRERSKDEISIAVLPFDNMSGERDQDYFSDGITEDIITEISRFRELRVIARNSSFQFRGGGSDVREIGRKLDAKFVIEGSVRRAGNRVRITVQLIEADSQAHIWSDRYDREMADIFEIQEEIARTIATRVAGSTRASVVERSISKPTESLSAYELFLRTRHRAMTYLSDDEEPEVERLFMRVIELDPQFAAVYGLLADFYVVMFLKTGDSSIIDKAVSFGRQGIAVNPEDASANYGLSIALIYNNALFDAAFYLKRAVDLNPNDVTFLGIYALWQSYVGRGEEALATIQEALRRDPYTQEWFWDVQGIIFAMQGLYAEAAQSFGKIRELHLWTRCFLAYCLSKAGNTGQAGSILAGFHPGKRDLPPSGLMDVILPDIEPAFRADFLETLRTIEATV